MPRGKPAGVRCVQLSDDYRCRIFGQVDRPACCAGLQPSEAMCADSRDAALRGLAQLEALTAP
jgi:hypothetical protein